MEVQRLFACGLSAFLILACEREPTVATAKPVRLQLKANTIRVGEKPVVAFASPFSKEGEGYWITVIEAAKADSEWGTWQYVDAGVREVALPAPTVAGRYEIRLHDQYPAQPYHVVARAALVVEEAAAGETSVRFELRSAELNVGDRPVVLFSALPKSSERYWITVIEAARPDSQYDEYQYVDVGTRELILAPVRAAGDYEVRLHSNYPDKPSNIVHRVRLRVRSSDQAVQRT